MDLIVITSSYPLQEDDAAAAAGLFVRDFALELARQGHQVRVLTQDRSGPRIEDPGVEVQRFAWRGNRPLASLRVTDPRDLLALLSIFRNGSRALDQMIERRRPDLILAVWAVPAGWLASLRCAHGVRYRVWTLGSDIWLYGRRTATRWLVRRILRGAESLFADGLDLAEETSRIAGRNCAFLPSSRNLPLGQPRPREFHPSRRNIVFVGRFHPHKGVDLLIEAIGLLDAHHRSAAKFHFFGGGPLEDLVRRRAQELQLEDSVEFHGYATPRISAACLEHADWVVIPSRLESIPVVLSDAARAGAPILATNVGDMGRMVRDDQAGCVVEPTPQAIRDGLVEMWESSREDFESGLSRLGQRFALDETVRTILR